MEGSEALEVIGIEEQHSPKELAEAAPATVISVTESLYAPIDDEFGTGERVGDLEGTYVVGHEGRAVCTVRFSFGDTDTIVATGVLPFERGQIRHGVLAVTGGTGRHKNRGGQVRVVVQNPKRYSFDP